MGDRKVLQSLKRTPAPVITKGLRNNSRKMPVKQKIQVVVVAIVEFVQDWLLLM